MGAERRGQVTLAQFDGILLQRQTPVPAPTSQVSSVVNAASYQPAIASGGFVSIVSTGFATSPRSWTSTDFSANGLPTSLDGVSVTINDQPAYVEYISPTQINAIALDDDTIGQVQVQVTTPQGPSYSGTVLKQKLSPAFFTYKSGTTTYAAAVHLDGALVGPPGPSSRPAVPGEVIELYGTGFGLTNPASPTAQPVGDGNDRRRKRAGAMGGFGLVWALSTERADPQCWPRRPASADERERIPGRGGRIRFNFRKLIYGQGALT